MLKIAIGKKGDSDKFITKIVQCVNWISISTHFGTILRSIYSDLVSEGVLNDALLSSFYTNLFRLFAQLLIRNENADLAFVEYIEKISKGIKWFRINLIDHAEILKTCDNLLLLKPEKYLTTNHVKLLVQIAKYTTCNPNMKSEIQGTNSDQKLLSFIRFTFNVLSFALNAMQKKGYSKAKNTIFEYLNAEKKQLFEWMFEQTVKINRIYQDMEITVNLLKELFQAFNYTTPGFNEVCKTGIESIHKYYEISFQSFVAAGKTYVAVYS